MSSFLTQDDYLPQIKADNMTAMIQSTPGILDTAEAEAISMVRTYLADLYDVDTIFAQTGSSRHAHLLRMCKTVVLYILHQRLPKRMAPEQVERDYADTIAFLERVSDGKIGLELPRKQTSEAKDVTRFRWGSHPRRSF